MKELTKRQKRRRAYIIGDLTRMCRYFDHEIKLGRTTLERKQAWVFGYFSGIAATDLAIRESLSGEYYDFTKGW